MTSIVSAVAAQEVARRAVLFRCAAVGAWLTPVLGWLILWAVTGTAWLPGSGGLRYVAVPFVALAAFAAFEDLSAVVRHRTEDAAALAALCLPPGATPGPTGVDVVVPSAVGQLAVVVLAADGPIVGTRSGRLATSTVQRRGVSPRRLLRTAEALGAEPVVVVPRCDDLDLDVALEGGTVRVVGARQWVEISTPAALAEPPAPATEHAQSAHDLGAETTGRNPT